MAIFSGNERKCSFAENEAEKKISFVPRKKPGEGPFPAANSSALRAAPGVCARNFRVPDSKFALRVFGSYKAIGRSSVSVLYLQFLIDI